MSKTIVITGASDGIGKAAARAFHASGHTVILVGRSADKTKALAAELGATYYLADFSKLSDVRKLATNLKKLKRIDVLALNAGGIFSDRVVTRDGFERTLQVNYLAHFLLVGLLMNLLAKSKASVISTASSAHWMARLRLDDLNSERSYRKWVAYGNAKLTNILFTRELNRRYAKKGIASAAFHPGVVRTSFGRDLGPVLRRIFSSRASRIIGMITPEEGADTLVWLAESAPKTDWKPGEYYHKRKVTRTSSSARNKKLAADLWNASEDLLLDKLEY